MATPRKATAAEETAATNKDALNDSVFSASELAEMSYMFNTTPDVVMAAFRIANKTEATFSTAKRIIKNFKDKEV